MQLAEAAGIPPRVPALRRPGEKSVLRLVDEVLRADKCRCELTEPVARH